MIFFKEVALYLRKSRFDDESETLEEVLARHEKLLADYCKRNNLIIKKIYREVVSGENIENRPQVQLLLEEVANGLYEGVVVVEIERLSRGNPIDQVEILETFKEAKAKIYTLQKVYDFSSDNDIDEEYFEFGLFMSRREYKTIKRRLIRGKKQAQQDGYYVGANLPFGFDKKRIGKGFVLVPNEQAEIVKILFNKYVYEGCNTSDLHEYLLQNNIKSAFGKDTWSMSSIRKLLKNRTYIGYIGIGSSKNRDKATWVKGKHEPILDVETFEKAQLKMKELDPRINIDKTPKNPLASLIICSKCGHTMLRRIDQRQKEFIGCNTRHCYNPSSYIVDIEKAIIQELQQELEGFNYFIENYGEAIDKKKENRQKEIELINKEITKKEAMINRCCEFLEEGIYTKEKYTQRVNILEQDLLNLRNNLIELEKNNNDDKEENIRHAIPILEKVINEYWSLSVLDKNALLKSIIEKVEYTKEKPQGAWASKNNIENNFELKIYMKI